ncbi:MAG TPA: sigma-70 family RNA polymerase sigma factor [Gammaproteobacteria bacterium]|nr:sigma-70 family RNA polymerase sigma factor [Gammaproteobacteria bacterium]
MRAIAARDQRALRDLYERSHRVVYTLVMRLTQNPETAEELTVDVFHDVWRRAASYDAASGTVLAWIMNQARSRAIDRLRFDGRKKRVDSGATEGWVAPTAGPHEAATEADRGRLVRAALTALTGDERQAIETAFFSELTYPETAEQLNQPLGTVKTRIRSALGKLRAALDSTETAG